MVMKLNSMFVGRVIEIGNSLGVVLPKKDLELKKVGKGDKVAVQWTKVVE